MKKIFVCLMLFTGSISLFGATTGNLTEAQIDAVQNLIRAYGYRCDGVNFALRSNWDGSISVSCNENKYSYEIKDIGGNWTVKVK